MYIEMYHIFINMKEEYFMIVFKYSVIPYKFNLSTEANSKTNMERNVFQSPNILAVMRTF